MNNIISAYYWAEFISSTRIVLICLSVLIFVYLLVCIATLIGESYLQPSEFMKKQYIITSAIIEILIALALVLLPTEKSCKISIAAKIATELQTTTLLPKERELLTNLLTNIQDNLDQPNVIYEKIKE